MKLDRRRLHIIARLTFLSLGAVIAACTSLPRQQSDNAIALIGVTVIDPTSDAPPRSDQTILISDGVIQFVGNAAVLQLPAGTRQIDATGKFAIPGLWDAHVHFMNTGVTALPLFLAHGVTSVREMGGYIDSTRAWQGRMRAGRLDGPRIITPGPMLESPQYLQNVRQRSVRDPRIGVRVLPYRLPVADSADAQRVIDSLVKLRVDFVKFRTVASPQAYFAIVRAAHRAGLKVAGHQPGVVTLGAAADSGQDDLEHGILPPLSRLPETTRDSIYRRFAMHGRWYTPTLTVSRAVMLTGDSAAKAIFSPEALRLDERRAFASPWLLEWWRMQVDERALDTSSTRLADMEPLYRSSTNDVRKMLDAGVKILAGTDAGSVLVYPGFGLHEELELLVRDARLTPREALWSATVGPARFAGLDARLGTIATGMTADIVLLDANPLQDIRATRRIFAVVQAGRVYDRARLDALLTGIRNSLGR